MKGKLDRNNRMFPLSYKGKLYYEKDCNDVFLAFYHDSSCLQEDTSVYMMGSDRIFPDGRMTFPEDDEDDDHIWSLGYLFGTSI